MVSACQSRCLASIHSFIFTSDLGNTMTDQNRKTLRSFYCRDYLWELFEQMTHELGCSMDYLINESMRLYARSRDFNADGAPGGMGGGPPAPGGMGGGVGGVGGGGFNGAGAPGGRQPVDRFNVGFQGGDMNHRTFERIPSVGQQGRPAPPAPGGGGGFGNSPAPPAPPGGLAGGPPPPPPRPNSGGGQQAPPQQPQGGFGGGQGFASGGRAPLSLIFNNNRYTIDKDKFVIGRGSQQTDLTIRDGNISRKHCAVIFHNGNYYIKDLGSTNGIEYRGNRIESKKIDEGDVFYLCDYELRFSYH